MDGNLRLSDKLQFVVVVPAYGDKLKSVYTQSVDTRICRYPRLSIPESVDTHVVRDCVKTPATPPTFQLGDL